MASARPMTSRGDWLCKSSRWRNSFGVCWFNIVFFKQCQFILLADWLHSFRSIKRRLHKKLVTRLSQEMCGIQGMSEMPICSSPQSSLVDLSSFGVGHGTYFYLQLELLEYTCPYPCPTHKIRTLISRATTVVHRYFITGGLPLPPWIQTLTFSLLKICWNCGNLSGNGTHAFMSECDTAVWLAQPSTHLRNP